MSKRKEMREKRRRQQRLQRTLTIGLIVTGALLVTFALIYPSIKPVGEVVVPTSYPRPMADGNSMGDPDAPVKMVEYSDFQCPVCARFARDISPLIVETYIKTGKVYFTYRSLGNFISDNISQATGIQSSESRDAIEAAYCAGDQNKFWEYHDILFANQTGEGVGDFIPRRLIAYAKALNLDMAAFQECITSHKYTDHINQDEKDGKEALASTDRLLTPAFTVNGELIPGALPFDEFQKTIEAALAAAG